MGKAESKKLLKREALMNTAFHLFTTKGINNTSISDIVEKAGAWFSIINPDTGELIDKCQGIAGVYKYLEDSEHEQVL